jgi:hypothetical protein
LAPGHVLPATSTGCSASKVAPADPEPIRAALKQVFGGAALSAWQAAHEADLGGVRAGAAVRAARHPDVGVEPAEPQRAELGFQLVEHAGQGPLGLGERQAAGGHAGQAKELRLMGDPLLGRQHAVVAQQRLHGRQITVRPGR